MFDHVAVHDILQMDYNKEITEQDLVDLGFKREDVSPEESGGDPYHFYFFKLSDNDYDNLGLLGCLEKTGRWMVELFPHRKRYENLAELRLVMETLGPDLV